MLRVTVVGNLGSDPELRQSNSGALIAGFRMAVNQVRLNGSGEREESTEWFRVNVPGRQVDYAAQLQRDQQVLVDDRLQITHFQRRDGTPGVGFDVWADEIQNVSGRSQADPDGRRADRGTAGDHDVAEAFDEADLPF